MDPYSFPPASRAASLDHFDSLDLLPHFPSSSPSDGSFSVLTDGGAQEQVHKGEASSQGFSNGGQWLGGAFKPDDEVEEGQDDDAAALAALKDTDDEPELSFLSPSAASSPSQGPPTPPDLDLDFSLAAWPFPDAPSQQIPSYEAYISNGVKCELDQDPTEGLGDFSFHFSPPFSPSSELRLLDPAFAPPPHAQASASPHQPELQVEEPSGPAHEPHSTTFRPRSLTQAEMDAFFGFVNLLALPPAPSQQDKPLRLEATPNFATPTPSHATLSATPKKRKRRVHQPEADQNEEISTKVGKRQKKEQPAERAYFQLEPIPALSAETGAPLTADEKRLAIITALQRLALSVLEQIVDNVVPPAALSDDEDPPARHWQPVKVKLIRRSRNDNDEDAPSKQQCIAFPRKCGQGDDLRLGGRELASLLKVIELILEGLDKRVVSTKRDLFYRNVTLFVKQQHVDSLIEDIAATLQVRRSDLNVVGSAKGLFAGTLRITTTDGKELGGSIAGTLIPPEQAIEVVELDEVKWVLVIEKEAVFQSLCSSTLLQDHNIGSGVLLTGKGYPDLATRELVKRLSDELPDTPLLALVDSDPHGLEILSTYRFGSASLSFDAANLTVARLEWLGVKGTEWDALGVDRDELLPLTRADRGKALGMLKREWLPDEWRRELEYMLHLGRKAEIQVLSSSSAAVAQPSQSASSSAAAGTEETKANPSRLVEYVKRKILEAVSRVDTAETQDE
ncbi:hypothetical protein JCM10207_006638 [Rhodosporidiobolus poonsookiae]